MKQMKRTGIYKASQVTFNPATLEASSYSWWIFVKRISGKTVFNSYRYSVTTAKHQLKVRRLMQELGIKIDFEVKTSRSLSEFKTIKEVKAANDHAAKVAAELEEIKRRARNAKAKARRDVKKLAAKESN